MKVIVNVDENCIEEQVIINCHELNENIINIQKTISAMENQSLKIELKQGEKEFYIDVGEILFFETDNNQVMAHTANEIFLTGSKLYELEKILPWYFSRISKSAILNVKKVYAITRNLTASSLIEFEGTPKHVYVSRAYYKPLKEKLEEEALNKKLEEEKIDITLSGTFIPSGSPSIIEKIVEETEEFFIGMGYDVLEGPEIELDKYNFEMLNLPKDHPARDAQDTYYLEGENILLRSQTSPVQVRTMLKGEGKTPIRMICPGKTYRREDINATHEQEFTQIEGLVIDKNISLSDLKGTFDAFIKNMFGEGVEARFRPSYYPFTEPSVEMDMSCIYCDGSGCSMCKPKGWITICGGGMVHPNVLKACGYDPNEWQGFAFGMAAERISMLKYGITDMRVCHENDLRETKNFDRKEIR